MVVYSTEEEKLFKQNYISTFLATWAANNYEDACMRGEQQRLSKPPVEDAYFLADESWKHIQEHRNDLQSID